MAGTNRAAAGHCCSSERDVFFILAVAQLPCSIQGNRFERRSRLFTLNIKGINGKPEPMQQVADHLIRSNSNFAEELLNIDRDIRAVKWRLWHGHVDRAIRDLERALISVKQSQREHGALQHEATGVRPTG
ncbi:hypothetical protein EMEDMD4_970009 [Sinorhizobium medicae]|uniref:Uncharacterized protein n=1 Tax=Sinorhizobium medicae TaxID=110321 RepID=A0A508XCH3_9HYPH|nr:hypothetical protein EMEDMD4_970009 [Sinorhizobium medicae]